MQTDYFYNEIQFPLPGNPGSRDLYFKTEQGLIDIDFEKKTVCLGENSILDCGTYFNSINVAQLKDYTKITSVEIQLEVSGNLRIEIHRVTKNKNKINDTVSSILDLNEKEKTIVSFRVPVDGNYLIYYKIRSFCEGGCFFGGTLRYNTGVPVIPARLAVVICTFKREDHVYGNIKNICARLSELNLCDGVEIYISDNGNSLEVKRIDYDNVHVYPNKNAGGSGGFTRGFIELVRSGRNHTHVLVMDDDILIDPEVLVKTYNFISCIKDEISNYFVGGSFLDIDKPCVQVEAGGRIREGDPIAQNTNKRLNELSSLLHSPVPDYDYFGWWYCCFPRKFLDNGYTLPIFIKRDDIEFCYRNKSKTILFNGIGVWHEHYLKKFSFENTYYQARNNLILNAIHFPDRQLPEIIDEVRRVVSGYIKSRRYCLAEMYLLGVEDFLKGYRWLMETDVTDLHQTLRGKTIKQIPFDNEIIDRRDGADCRDCKNNATRLTLKNRLTMNGHLFSFSKKVGVVPINIQDEALFMDFNEVFFYNASTGLAYSEKKSFSRFVRLTFWCRNVCRKLAKQYHEVLYSYNVNLTKMVNEAFWKKYLGI